MSKTKKNLLFLPQPGLDLTLAAANLKALSNCFHVFVPDDPDSISQAESVGFYRLRTINLNTDPDHWPDVSGLLCLGEDNLSPRQDEMFTALVCCLKCDGADYQSYIHLTEAALRGGRVVITNPAALEFVLSKMNDRGHIPQPVKSWLHMDAWTHVKWAESANGYRQLVKANEP